MDLGEHFKDSPIICFEGTPLKRAEELADTILHISETNIVWGYSFVRSEVAPELPSVSDWKTREDLIDFIRTHAEGNNIAFIVFGRHSLPNRY
jgi:hypothetical protein